LYAWICAAAPRRVNPTLCPPFFFPAYGPAGALHSFPTRRSSDLGGDETGTVARGLPSGLPTGWNGRRQPHHPQPPPVPLRHCSRSEEHTSELQSRFDLVCRLLLEKKNNTTTKLFTYHSIAAQ